MKTIYELQQEAIRLRQAREVDSISPEETFGLHADTLAYLADMEQNAEGLGIHKVYKSFAAMNADSSAPVGTNGKPLRFGQLVAVYDKDNLSQAENGNIYAFQKGAEAGWLLIGNLKSELAKITITEAQIADGAITAAKLADGSVKNRHLASNCVTSDKLQPGAVKHDHLTEDCISTGNIRDGSVTAKKLGTDIYKDIANRVTDIVTKDFPPAITEEQITDITSK